MGPLTLSLVIAGTDPSRVYLIVPGQIRTYLNYHRFLVAARFRREVMRVLPFRFLSQSSASSDLGEASVRSITSDGASESVKKVQEVRESYLGVDRIGESSAPSPKVNPPLHSKRSRNNAVALPCQASISGVVKSLRCDCQTAWIVSCLSLALDESH